jgi:hypothetical protein
VADVAVPARGGADGCADGAGVDFAAAGTFFGPHDATSNMAAANDPKIIFSSFIRETPPTC